MEVKKIPTDIQFLILIIAAIIGALTAAGLGWSSSNEPFNAKKFVNSLIRGIIAAVILTVGYYMDTTKVVTFLDYLIAWGFGAGIDVIGHRASTAIS